MVCSIFALFDLINRAYMNLITPSDSSTPQSVLTLIQTLTQSERKIIRLIAEGLTTADIAEKICRSPNTVDNQRASASRKLNLEGRNCLVRFAIEYRAYL